MTYVQKLWVSLNQNECSEHIRMLQTGQKTNQRFSNEQLRGSLPFFSAVIWAFGAHRRGGDNMLKVSDFTFFEESQLSTDNVHTL